MAPPAGSGQQQQDGSYSALWLTIGIFILVALIWHYFHAPIVNALFHVKLGEIKLMSHFVPHLREVRDIILSSPASSVSFKQLAMISTSVGNYLRYPLTLILVLLGALMYFSNPVERFRRSHTMKSLLEVGKQVWPQIIPVSRVDLVSQHVEKGRWAIALTPMQFCKKYHLLLEEMDPSKYDPRIKRIATLLPEKAERVFAMQMGARWRGVEQLPLHAKALFAAFAARGNEDRDASNQLLDQIASSSVTGKLNFKGTDALIRKHINTKKVARVISLHAYEMSVLASLLVLARTDGVVASAEFLWIKPIDRRLWFMMNTIGRQTAVPEVAGPFSHWKTELLLKRPLPIPMVKEAVYALDGALKDVIYKPTGEED